MTWSRSSSQAFQPAAPGSLYVGTGDGTLLALDTGDGHELWRAPLGAAPSADPALAEGQLYFPLTTVSSS